MVDRTQPIANRKDTRAGMAMNGREIASIKKRRITPWLAASVMCGAVAGALASVPVHSIGWSGDFSFGEFVNAYLKMRANGLVPFLLPESGPKARESLAAFPGWMGTFHSLIAAGCAGCGWLLRDMLAPRDDTIYIRGARLHDHKGNKAFAKATAPKDKEAERGVDFIPGLPFDQVRWFSHIAIYGGTGWGKSVVIRNWLNQIVKRKRDKLLMLAVKSEDIGRYPFAILDPMDSRSLYWDIAADNISEAEADNFADFIVVRGNGQDAEVWAKAEKLCTAGMMVKLQTIKPLRWTWGDLCRELIRSPEEIRADLKEYAPAKLNAMPEAAQTQSGVLFNMAGGSLSVIAAIANAYALLERSADFESRKFSFRDWAENENPRHGKIVLRMNGSMRTQSEAFIVAAIGFYTQLIISPNMSELPSVWTWLFLDEFAQIPKMKHLQTVPAVGRGRRIAMIYGTQLMSQVIDTYGESGSKTYTEIPQTTVFGYLSASDADKAVKFLGSQDISKPTQTTSSSVSGTSSSVSNQETTRTIVHADEFSSLKAGLGFVKVGSDVFKVQFPYAHEPKNFRPKFVRWTHTKAGYKFVEKAFREARKALVTVREVMGVVRRANQSLDEKYRLTGRDLMNILVMHGMHDGVARTYRTWEMLMEKIGHQPLDAVLSVGTRIENDISAFLVDEHETDELLDPSDASFLDDGGEEIDEPVNETNETTAEEAEAVGEADQDDKPVKVGGKEAAMRLRGLLNQGKEAT